MPDVILGQGEWPPVYTLQRHRRAKYVKLRVCRVKGLVITIPMRFSLKDIPSVLEEHRHWINKHLSDWANRKRNEMILPTSFRLACIEATYQVLYLKSSNKLNLLERPGNELVLSGQVKDEAHYLQLLKQWLRKKADAILSEALHRVSQEMQLPFTRMNIRNQQTVWGSCTADKAISLNYRLIFLPENVMRYILVHELAHTVFLNHSTSFWQLVEKYDPHWTTHRRMLKQPQNFIPAWIG